MCCFFRVDLFVEFLSKSILSGCYFFEFQSLNKKIVHYQYHYKEYFCDFVLIHYKCEN